MNTYGMHSIHGRAPAIATGVAVAAGGMIGFVGLVVPHAMRLLLGADNRLLLPAVAVAGGVFLTAADCVARSLIAPIQLPVGVVTALVGGPIFIWLLHRSGLSLRSVKRGSVGIRTLEAETGIDGHQAQSLRPLLSVYGFTLKSNNRTVCDSLHWTGHAGQVWAVIGNSGIGKSTLMRSLAGLHNEWCQQTGGLFYQGKSLVAMPLAERACHLAWMPQSDQVPFPCTVRDRVLAGLHPHGKAFSWETQQDLLTVSLALEKVGLQDLEFRILDTLSGGERRRVEIARALATVVDVLRIGFFASMSVFTVQMMMKMGSYQMTIIDLPMNIVYGVCLFGFVMMAVRSVWVLRVHLQRGYSVLERPETTMDDR